MFVILVGFRFDVLVFKLWSLDGYRTAMKLRVEGYPFCCVVHRVGHNLMLRCKVEGLIDVEELLSKLGKTLQDVVNARVRQRQAEVERNEMYVLHLVLF
jgi:hypothetical protein